MRFCIRHVLFFFINLELRLGAWKVLDLCGSFPDQNDQRSGDWAITVMTSLETVAILLICVYNYTNDPNRKTKLKKEFARYWRTLVCIVALL